MSHYPSIPNRWPFPQKRKIVDNLTWCPVCGIKSGSPKDCTSAGDHDNALLALAKILEDNGYEVRRAKVKKEGRSRGRLAESEREGAVCNKIDEG